MANTITFLKNYQRFAWNVRLISAKSYLASFKTSQDEQEKKVMMLRITDELISSTEDLAMWIAAIESRKNPTKQFRDVWEFMLQVRATDDQIAQTLNEIARVRTALGLIKKLKLASIKHLSVAAKMDEPTLTAVLEKILEAVKEAKHNRTASRGVLLRFHNKVKHGMMIQDYGNELFIRDLKTKMNKKLNRISRKNRNLYLQIDIDRAEKMVGTIEANCYAMHGLVSLVIYDFIDQLLNKKRKLTEKQKKFWAEALNG